MDRFRTKAELGIEPLSQSPQGVFCPSMVAAGSARHLAAALRSKRVSLTYWWRVVKPEHGKLARGPVGLGLPQDQNQQPPRFDSWELLLRENGQADRSQRLIIIFDEFPYAVESDPSFSFPSAGPPPGITCSRVCRSR